MTLFPNINAKDFNRMVSLDPWEHKPVTIEEFILSPKYLDLSREIYSRIFDILSYTFGDDPKEMYQINDLNFIGGIGCLSGDTKIIDTSGKIHYIRDLVNKELEVFALNKKGDKTVKAKAIGKYSGRKEVYKILTESGREICATSNHLFYSDSGWMECKKLLNRGILCSNKVQFNQVKNVKVQDNILNLMKSKSSIKSSKNSHDFQENIEKELLNLPTYNKKILNDLMSALKTSENNDYDIFTNASPIIKAIGLKTGDIISKESNSVLKFKHNNPNIPHLLFDKVVSVLYIGETNVYDLEVDEYENFMLYDGMIVHNSGKTYLGAIAQIYLFYKLCCLKDCRRYFGKGYDKPFSLVNCAPSANKARKLVFQAIKENILKCEFFKQFDLLIQSQEIKKFTSGGNLELSIFSGSSTPNSIIGLNVYSVIIDETCFFEKSSDRDYFEELYKGAKGRMASRFGDRGFIACLSSPVSIDDYAWKRTQDIKKEGKELILPKSESIRLMKQASQQL